MNEEMDKKIVENKCCTKKYKDKSGCPLCLLLLRRDPPQWEATLTTSYKKPELGFWKGLYHLSSD